jgi:hypothetical protein
MTLGRVRGVAAFGATALAAAVLTACTSSHPARRDNSSPSPTRPSTATPSAPVGSSSAVLPSGASNAAAQLDKELRAGVASVRSVHLELSTKVSGQTVLGTGDEQLSDGRRSRWSSPRSSRPASRSDSS